MIPQFLKVKEFSIYYKILTLIVIVAALLPEYVAMVPVIILFFAFWKHNYDNNKHIIFGRTGKLMLAFVFVVFASFVWSQEPVNSFVTGSVWLFGAFAFLLISNMSDTKDKIENIILCMVAATAINALVTIVQMAFMATGYSKYFPNPLYRTLDNWVYDLLNYDAAYQPTADRVAGLFDSPLILATFFVIVFPLAAFCCFYATTKKRRIFSIISCGLIFFGIMFTFLRAAVIAVIISFMILAFTGKKPAKVMSLVAAATGVIMFIVIIERRGASTSQDLSTNFRIHIWETCLKSIAEKPLLGLGAGSDNVRDLLLSNGMDFPNSHNLYIELLTQLGVVGFVVFAAMMISVVFDIITIYKCEGWWKRYAVALSASLVGLFTMSLFDHTLFTAKEVLYFLIVLGCVESSKRVAQKNKELYKIGPKEQK